MVGFDIVGMCSRQQMLIKTNLTKSWGGRAGGRTHLISFLFNILNRFFNRCLVELVFSPTKKSSWRVRKIIDLPTFRSWRWRIRFCRDRRPRWTARWRRRRGPTPRALSGRRRPLERRRRSPEEEIQEHTLFNVEKADLKKNFFWSVKKLVCL